MSRLTAYVLLLTCVPWFSKAAEPKKTEKAQNQQALSLEMLLFLADMEEVDGELVHPVDLIDAPTKADAEKSKQQNRQNLSGNDKAQNKGNDDEQN